MNSITSNKIGKLVKLPEWQDTEAIRVLKILTGEEYKVLFRSEDVDAVGCGDCEDDGEYFLGVDAEYKLHIYGCRDDWQFSA